MTAPQGLRTILPFVCRLFQFPVGVADFVERVDAGDGNLQLTVGNQRGEFPEDVGACRRRGALGLGAVLRRAPEVDDRVDPFSGYAEFQRQFDVGGAEGVDEGVDRAVGRGADALADAFSVGHRDRSVPGEPCVVGLARQTDDGGPGQPSELHDERAHPTGGPGDDDGLATPDLDGVHRRVRRAAA